jgi:predicted  nucleic acid-binding Zn-ribbon protein
VGIVSDPGNVDLLRQFLGTLKKIDEKLTAVEERLTGLENAVRANTREIKEGKKKKRRYGRSWATRDTVSMSSKMKPMIPLP